MSDKLVQAQGKEQPAAPRYFEPYADIWEEGNSIHCLVDMPGVEKQGVDVTYDKGSLSITGKVSSPVAQKWAPISEEYNISDYKRVISFADVIDSARIEANLENGVLHLTIPRKEDAVRSIEVKVN